jgi:hypothetical protein
MSVLDLHDADYWETEVVVPNRNEVVGEVLEREDPRGVVIDAPTSVAIDRYKTLPVLGYYVRRMKDDQGLSFDRRAIATATCLETNHVRVGVPFDDGRLRGESEHSPMAMLPGAVTVDMFDGDWHGATNLPWEPGRHRLALMLREHLSNQVEVNLERSIAYEDPEVLAFLEAQQSQRPAAPPTVHPPHPEPALWGDEAPDAAGWLPRYLEVEGSPPVPEEEGIALAVERVQIRGPRCILRGSFRLPLLRHEIVRPDTDVGDPAASGVVPITLVGTASEVLGPFVFRLAVPTYTPLDLTVPELPVVTGWFTVDLFALGLPTTAQTYFFTAFNGAHAVGPTPFALVSEAMLRVTQ